MRKILVIVTLAIVALTANGQEAWSYEDYLATKVRIDSLNFKLEQISEEIKGLEDYIAHFPIVQVVQTQNKVFVDININETVELVLYNIIGKVLYKTTTNNYTVIETASFKSGVYFLKVNLNGRNIHTRKIVIE